MIEEVQSVLEMMCKCACYVLGCSKCTYYKLNSGLILSAIWLTSKVCMLGWVPDNVPKSGNCECKILLNSSMTTDKISRTQLSIYKIPVNLILLKFRSLYMMRLSKLKLNSHNSFHESIPFKEFQTKSKLESMSLKPT